MPNSYWLRASPAAQALAGRWTLAVLTELANGGGRYQDLLDALDGVSHKVLTDTLRRAERDGLVVRHLDARRVDTATCTSRLISPRGQPNGEAMRRRRATVR
jgi:hypothetical protein